MNFWHIVAAVCVAAAWGFNFVVIKIGLEEFPPLFLSALRFTAAALPAIFFTRFPTCGWKPILSIGIVLGTIKFSLLFWGIEAGASAGLASLILQAQVFFTIILAMFLYGERLTHLRIFGLFLGFCGLATVGIQTGGGITTIGFILIIAAAIAWAIANIIMRTLGKINLLHFIVWMSLVPIVPLLCASAIIEYDSIREMTNTLAAATWRGILAILFAGVISTVLGFAIWGRLLTLYSAATVTPFAFLVPVAGIFSGWLFLDERISGGELGGAILIMLGLACNIFGARKTKI